MNVTLRRVRVAYDAVRLTALLVLLGVAGCKTGSTTTTDADDGGAAGAVGEANPDQPNQTDADEAPSTTSQDGAHNGFRLQQQAVTSANQCTSGDSACLGNGAGMACATNNGDLGICTASEYLGCECRAVANAPLVAAGDLPAVAAGAACSTSASQYSCSGKQFGVACSAENSDTGYCAPRNFNGKVCGCGTVDEVETYAQGNACDFVGSAPANPCQGLNEGAACLIPSSKETGVCLSSTASGSRRCGCVKAVKEPILPDRFCAEVNGTDVQCRGLAVGKACGKDGIAGSCLPANATSFNTTLCSCQVSKFDFRPVDEVVCSQTGDCNGKRIGEACLADSATPGLCVMGAVNGVGRCECLGSSAPDAPAPSPKDLGVYQITTTGLTLRWRSGGGSTKGFVVAQATGAVPPATCAGGVDVQASTSRAITGLAVNTQYSFRICAYNGVGANSSGSLATAATSTARSASSQTLFSDDFNRANNTTLGSPWVENIADHAIVDNMLRAQNAPSIMATAGAAVNLVIETDYSLAGSTNRRAAGVVARHTGTDPSRNMYFATIDQGATIGIIWRNVNGTWTKIATGTANLAPSGRLKFSLSGSTLRLFVNNLLVTSATDSSLAASGRYGVRTGESAGTVYDNFIAYTP